MIWQNKVFRNKLFSNYIIITTVHLPQYYCYNFAQKMNVFDAYPFENAGYPSAGNLAQYY